MNAVLSVAHKSSDLFKHGSHQYFEFTHHNPLTNEDDKHLLHKRASRQIQLRRTAGRKIFAYHHRSKSGFSKESREILSIGGRLLNEKYSSACSIFFSQEIIRDGIHKRGYEIDIVEGNQAFLTLFTINAWQGNDPDQFFARQDNDILQNAFSACAKELRIDDTIEINAY